MHGHELDVRCKEEDKHELKEGVKYAREVGEEGNECKGAGDEHSKEGEMKRKTEHKCAKIGSVERNERKEGSPHFQNVLFLGGRTESVSIENLLFNL